MANALDKKYNSYLAVVLSSSVHAGCLHDWASKSQPSNASIPRIPNRANHASRDRAGQQDNSCNLSI